MGPVWQGYKTFVAKIATLWRGGKVWLGFYLLFPVLRVAYA